MTAAAETAPETGPPAGPVILDMSMWCARHLDPYRARWPEGFGVAMVRLFDAAVHMDAVADCCGGDAELLGLALHRFSPLCCFIPREALQAIYAETVPGRQEGAPGGRRAGPAL